MQLRSASASETSADDLRRLGSQLGAAQRSELRWDAHADSLEARAIDMRRLADQLADHNDPLRRSLDPVRHLHIIGTWEGNAATDSRRRLDTIEDQLFVATRTIDEVIDDLTNQAREVDRSADDARENVTSTRRRIAQLRRELGEFEDAQL